MLTKATLRGLYAIVDPATCGGHDPLWVTDAILEGGCAILQLRAKEMDDRALMTLAESIQRRCHAKGIPFVLNDRADLAALVGADGLHLGQDDLPVEAARELFPGHIGLSTHNPEQAGDGFQRADLIGVGPVFRTESKVNPDPEVGLETLHQICQRAPIPTVAIGGIQLENAHAVFEAGADLVAMISGLVHHGDPASVAATVHGMGMRKGQNGWA